MNRYDEAKHPRDRRGQYAHKGGILSAAEARRRHELRVRNAIISHKVSNAAVHKKSAEAERYVARMIGTKPTTNNAAMDIVYRRGRTLVGIEVKSIQHNKNKKITIHPDSRRRKIAWAEQHRASLVTVLVDMRGSPVSNPLYRTLYSFKAGVGAYRYTAMTRFKKGSGASALRSVLAAVQRPGHQ